MDLCWSQTDSLLLGQCTFTFTKSRWTLVQALTRIRKIYIKVLFIKLKGDKLNRFPSFFHHSKMKFCLFKCVCCSVSRTSSYNLNYWFYVSVRSVQFVENARFGVSSPYVTKLVYPTFVVADEILFTLIASWFETAKNCTWIFDEYTGVCVLRIWQKKRCE